MRQEEVRQVVRQEVRPVGHARQVDRTRQLGRAHLVHLVRLRRVRQGGPEALAALACRALRVPSACE